MSIADFIAVSIHAPAWGATHTIIIDPADAEQWEAFTERAGIMEYEGGLDRKAATLAAFALYFPGDYRAMKETAAAYPDGETIMYEYLEGLIKNGPQSVIEGPRMNAETEKAETHGKAPDRPPMAYYEGIEAFSYVTQRGMKITPCKKNDSGDYAFLIPYKTEYEILLKQNPDAKISDCKGFTSNIETIKKRISEGVEIFRFIPSDNGFLCLDIDKGHASGKDGITAFYKLFDRDLLPETLKDIEAGTFPCYTRTPSGGLHLYFKYDGPPVKNGELELAPGVEAKHGSPGLNAPGSAKQGKPYILYGELKDAPRLYPIIKKLLTEKTAAKSALTKKPAPQRAAADRPAPRRAWVNPNRQRITLDTLADEAAAAYGGHHDRQVSFAGKVCRMQLAARQKGNNTGDFTAAAAFSDAKGRPDIFGNGADTEGTIKSVFNDNGGI